jgi:hypothetical protein
MDVVDGETEWARHFGGPSSDLVLGMDVKDGVVALGGSFATSVSFGGDTLVEASGVGDGFVARLSATDGGHVASRAIGGAGDSDVADYTYDVALSGGRVYATGRFSGIVDFGDGAITSSAFTDAYVARYY